MALVKAEIEVMDSVTVVAATPNTSAWQSLNSIEDGAVNIHVLNGATGPTDPVQVQLQTSSADSAPSGMDIINFGGPLQADLGNNVATSWGPLPLPRGTRHIRAIASGNTGQNVTVRVTVGSQTN